MNIEELRDYCLSLKAVEETLPFGPETLVFKVMDKAFLLAGLDSIPLQFNVKCDPGMVIELRDRFDCVLPGYHTSRLAGEQKTLEHCYRRWIGKR